MQIVSTHLISVIFLLILGGLPLSVGAQTPESPTPPGAETEPVASPASESAAPLDPAPVAPDPEPAPVAPPPEPAVSDEPAPSATPPAPTSTEYSWTSTEAVFVGYTYSTALEGGHGVYFGLSILKWDKIYWQIAELAVASVDATYPEYGGTSEKGTGYQGSLASIVGYRHALSDDERHELRAGLGLGWYMVEDRGDCIHAEGGCEEGAFSHDFHGVGLQPEVGWIWRLPDSFSPGKETKARRLLQVKLRLSIPIRHLSHNDGDGKGTKYAYCQNDDCPWASDGDDLQWTPDLGISLNVGVGF